MKKLVYFLALGIVFIASCKKPSKCEPGMVEIDGECYNLGEELITTLLLRFDDSTSIDTFAFNDLDGLGGNAPSIDTIHLHANTIYNMKVYLWNNMDNPPVNITDEIEAEKDEHQFFYIISSYLKMEGTYRDVDDNNLPVGLDNTIETFAPSTGEFTVVLKHQAENKNGDYYNGETDLEAKFYVIIE